MPPRTRYAKYGDLSIAYQTFGEGDVDIVNVPSFVSHLDYQWAQPAVKSFYQRLGRFARITIFDKAGTGLSDPVAKIPTIEDRANEIEAVMDAAGIETAALFGTSEGGPMTMFFAATRPHRVTALALFGTFARGFSLEHLLDPDLNPDEYRKGLIDRGWPERDLPSDDQINRLAKFTRHAFNDWGDGAALSTLIPTMGDKLAMGYMERACASPALARAALRSGAELDVTDVLETIRVPTVVVHVKDDLVPIQASRVIAETIPNAQLIEFEGTDHAPWISNPDVVVGELEELVTGNRHPPEPNRVLTTVLFTDIVGSTTRAAELGDARWRALLEIHDEITSRQIREFDGTHVKSTGDGVLATFGGPASALNAARAIRDGLKREGVVIRAGLHTGEIERLGNDVGGLAVHIAARVCALAGPEEILVSRTVPDLVVGSGLAFEDRGTHELKGVPDPWQLLALADQTTGASANSDVNQVAIGSRKEHQTFRDQVAMTGARTMPSAFRAAIRLRRRRRAHRGVA